MDPSLPAVTPAVAACRTAMALSSHGHRGLRGIAQHLTSVPQVQCRTGDSARRTGGGHRSAAPPRSGPRRAPVEPEVVQFVAILSPDRLHAASIRNLPPLPG